MGQGTLDAIRPSCVYSQKCNLIQLRYATFERELLTIINSLYFFEA